MISNKTKMYMFNFFRNLTFHRGIFLLFLESRGLTTSEVGVLQCIYYLSIFFFEIPTGYFADLYGKKRSIILGLFIFVFAGLGTMFSYTFLSFVVLFSLEGLAKGLLSGADESFFYSNVIKETGKDQYIKSLTRYFAIGFYTLSIAIFIGGFLQRISWMAVYGSFSLMIIISILPILTIDEPQSKNILPKYVSMKHFLLSPLHDIKSFSHTPLAHVLCIMFILFALFESSIMVFYTFSQRAFMNFGINIETVSILYAINRVFSGLSNDLTDTILKKFSKKFILYFGLFSTGVIMLSTLLTNMTLYIAVFLTIMIVPNIMSAIASEYSHHNIPENIQASILSCRSCMESLIAGITYLLFSYAISYGGLMVVSGLLGTISILCGILFLLLPKSREAFSVQQTT